MPVVGREADTKHLFRVTNETPARFASIEVPQSESLVPRRREGELTIGGDGQVSYKVIVASELLAGVTNRFVRSIAFNIPKNDSLVARTGQEDIRIL